MKRKKIKIVKSTHDYVVGLIRPTTNSIVKDVRIPRKVFKGVDCGDFLTMSQVIDEWLLKDGFEGFVVWSMKMVPRN